MKLSLKLGAVAAGALLVGLFIGTPAQADPITVPANAHLGVSTGISVPADGFDTITITATGSAGYGYEGGGCTGYPMTTPDGSRTVDGRTCAKKDDPNAALANAPIGLLIAETSPGNWQAIGASGTVRMLTSGTLTVAYNDVVGSYSDNTGSYAVTLSIVTTIIPPPHTCTVNCPQ